MINGGAARGALGRVRLPTMRVRPVYAALTRLGLALVLLFAVVGIVYLDRGGYRDSAGGPLSLLDAAYSPTASIVACVRESENEPLLAQSGADQVITTSETAGRLLGTAAAQPQAGSVVHDLLIQGTGQDLLERDIHPHEVGRHARDADDLVVAIIRGDHKLPYDHPACTQLEAGDRLVVVRSARGEGTGG